MCDDCYLTPSTSQRPVNLPPRVVANRTAQPQNVQSQDVDQPSQSVLAVSPSQEVNLPSTSTEPVATVSTTVQSNENQETLRKIAQIEKAREEDKQTIQGLKNMMMELIQQRKEETVPKTEAVKRPIDVRPKTTNKPQQKMSRYQRTLDDDNIALRSRGKDPSKECLMISGEERAAQLKGPAFQKDFPGTELLDSTFWRKANTFVRFIRMS